MSPTSTNWCAPDRSSPSPVPDDRRVTAGGARQVSTWSTGTEGTAHPFQRAGRRGVGRGAVPASAPCRRPAAARTLDLPDEICRPYALGANPYTRTFGGLDHQFHRQTRHPHRGRDRGPGDLRGHRLPAQHRSAPGHAHRAVRHRRWCRATPFAVIRRGTQIYGHRRGENAAAPAPRSPARTRCR